MKKPLRIGTRASKLARAQAQKLAEVLESAHPSLRGMIQTVPMTTAGDRELHKTLSDWGYKGLFTKELEDALLDGRIDLAVHSMKDMPSVLPDGLLIAGMLERADVRDAWISNRHDSLSLLPKDATVGSSSARRIAQLLHLRPDVKIVPLRGNVETRLRKIEEGVAEATFLAVAGLERLGLESAIRDVIETEVMLPAAGQGAIAMECRADDADTRVLLASISHADTMTCVAAEREMLRELDGSCRTPIGGLAQLNGNTLTLRGEVLSLDGTIRHARDITGDAKDVERIGVALGKELRAVAGDILVNPGVAHAGT